jgi:protein TonB
MHWQAADADDSVAGPIILELVSVPVETRRDTPDVAHGPLMQEAQLMPPAAKEAKAEVEKELPPVAPSPAPEPEVTLPKPQPEAEKKPEEEKLPREEAPQQQSASQAAPAPLTTAPPRVEAKEAPVAPAVAAGTAASDTRSAARWERALVAHLNRHKRYPDAARARKVQGAVSVAFTIDRTGSVLDVRITSSSGSPVLDEEALAVVRRASPLPPPPSTMKDAALHLTLPVEFKIR